MKNSLGYYFLHATETCLIGVKADKGNKLQFLSKVNLIF